MAYKNPVKYAVDQTARDSAAAAQTAANTAQSTANNALSVASARNHVFVQSTAPTTGTAALTLDDLWIDPGNGNRISSWDGAAWQPVALGTAAFAAESITTDLLAAGAVAAGNLAADAINGRTITGGAFYTAPTTSGAGVSIAEGTDGLGNPVGIVQFTDSQIGVPEAHPAILKMADTYTGGSITGRTFSLSGGTLAIGAPGGTAAPELDLNVEASGSGYAGVARLTAGVFYLNGALVSFPRWLGDVLGTTDPTSTSTSTTVVSLTVTIPANLPAGATIKVTGIVFCSTPTGVGATLTLGGRVRPINQGGINTDLSIVLDDTDLTPGSRTYLLKAGPTVAGQTITCRRPYLQAEIV